MDDLNPVGTKGAATPGSKATATNDPHSEDNLTSQKAERYRSLAGRLLHHSLDDPRVQFGTGLVMRGMSAPRVLDEARLQPSGALHRGTRCGLAVSLAGRRRDVEAFTAWRTPITQPTTRAGVA